MRKSTRIVKKLLALFLLVLMSINTLGAVVSDNDGSAFITKAEFDSLKNDFQSQIDQYNTSIDMKIDGAIGAYLAGIKMSSQKEQKIMFTQGDEVVSLKLDGDNRIKYEYGNIGYDNRSEYDYVSFNDLTSGNRYKKIVSWDSHLEQEDIHKLYIKNLNKELRIAEWDGHADNATEYYSFYYVYVNKGSSGIAPQPLSGTIKQDSTNIGWQQVSTLVVGDPLGAIDQKYMNSGTMNINMSYRGRELYYGHKQDQVALVWSPVAYNRFNLSDGENIGFGNLYADNDYGTPEGSCHPLKIRNVVHSIKNEVYAAQVSATDASSFVSQKDEALHAVNNLDDDLTANQKNIWPGDRWADRWITNWNQLYISAYGKFDDSNLENKYLYLYNGFPLLAVKMGDIVTWTFRIKETGTYILKAGLKPFNADNTSDEPLKISVDDALNLDEAEFSGGLDHKLKIDFDSINPINENQERIVYIKWSEKDENGGGTLNLEGDYKKIYVTNET